MKLLLINIAGFASDGNNKHEQLRSMFPDAVTSNVLTSGRDPYEVIAEIKTIANSYINTTPILVGSSLGGFYAQIASVRLGIPCVLINPSLRPWETLQDKIGTNSYFGGDTFVVTPDDLLKMREMVNLIEGRVGLYDEIDDPPYALFTGAADERLDHTVTRSLLRYPNIDVNVAGFDHQFSDISIIKSAIEFLENYKVATEDDSFTPHDPVSND